jgi:hypothetical protein
VFLPKVRQEALKALGTLTASERRPFVDAIVERTHDADKSVRKESFASLAQMDVKVRCGLSWANLFLTSPCSCSVSNRCARWPYQASLMLKNRSATCALCSSSRWVLVFVDCLD